MNKIKKGLGRGLSSLIGESKIETTTNKLLIGDLYPNKFQPRKIFDENGLNDLESYQTLLGVTGSGKTFTIANVINNVYRPTLVLCLNKADLIKPDEQNKLKMRLK